MSEVSFEQLLDESFKTIRNGEIVEGTVITVKPEEAALNIALKNKPQATEGVYIPVFFLRNKFI